MTHKELQDLIKLVSKSNLTEFKLKKGDLSLSIRTKKYVKGQSQPGAPSIVHVPAAPPSAQMPQPAAAPAAPAQAAPAPQVDLPKESSAEGNDNLIEVRSPIVGTFYRASSPDKPPFVKVGDKIEVGSVVCIVEAMKLFNEIESEVAGEIVKVLAEDASPVEYDQPLFLIDPSK
jgi:acetyl-CoA carboxylase biotin carboxyl carrier protein